MKNPKNTPKTRANVTVVDAAAKQPSKAAAQAPAKTAPKPAPASASAVKPKPRLVRDSFTIPKSEYLVLEGLKLRAANLARPVKKSELLRAGIAVLQAMNDKAFLAALNAVPSLKTGRPKAADGAPAPGKGAS